MFPGQVPAGYQLVPVEPKKKFRITAVIPTVQYGNIQPEYEVEADSYEEAEKIAMPYIEALWDKYCAKGSELPKKETVKEDAKASGKTTKKKFEVMLSEITGVTAYFQPDEHFYVTSGGKRYISGSTFAHKFTPEFDEKAVLEAMKAKNPNLDTEAVSKMWKLKGEVSTNFGTAIHAALEMYGKNHELGQVLGANKKPVVNTALHDHPIIKPVVEKFFKDRMNENAKYEVFVADDKLMWCGQIDRLLIVDEKKKICRIQDYKTNADVNKKGFNGKLLAPFDNMPDTPLSGYWLQLSFYARIMEKHGWTVEGLDVLHLDGDEWVTYTREVIDLKDF